MKIYEIGTGYTPIPAQMGAATEIVVEELTRSFIKNGEDAQIIDIKAKKRAPTDLPITEVAVPSVFAGTDVSLGIMHKLKRVVYSVALAKKLKKILSASDEQVLLHFHNQYNLYFFLKLTSKKVREKATVAYTVHSYIWGDEWKKIEKTVRERYFQEIYCVKNADAVLVLNDRTAEHFTKRLGVDSGKIHRIRNGVNTQKYTPMPTEKVAECKRANGLEDKKMILQVGSVCERKNQLGTVKMLAEYLRGHKDVVFMYAGGIIDGEYNQKILDHAIEHGIEKQVRYAGEISPGEQLNTYYNMADCSVFTSTLESFGLVIIEAISSSTPVIVGTDLMFELDGGYSIYTTEAEFVSLVDRALNSGDTDAQSLRAAADRYSWDRVALEHAGILAKKA